MATHERHDTAWEYRVGAMLKASAAEYAECLAEWIEAEYEVCPHLTGRLDILAQARDTIDTLIAVLRYIDESPAKPGGLRAKTLDMAHLLVGWGNVYDYCESPDSMAATAGICAAVRTLVGSLRYAEGLG